MSILEDTVIASLVDLFRKRRSNRPRGEMRARNQEEVEVGPESAILLVSRKKRAIVRLPLTIVLRHFQ